ncbi:MAG: DUF1080 domain-containing protein [Chthoniobacter sp.]|nr:DUF1080 domain-containing protein [Chthoniobacter sp.]
MINRRALLAAGALLALTFTSRADDTNVLTDAEKAAGWKLLFDGQTLEGWQPIGKSGVPTKGWVVREGMIFHGKAAGGGDIVTVEQFGSRFELTWEWRIGAASNSGVKYSLPDPEKNVGFEYQLIDDENHPDGKRGGRSHQTGALYDLIEPAPERKVKPVGEWNQSRLIVESEHVQHWLNGVKIVEFYMGSDDMKARIAKSKFRNVPHFGGVTRSPILLQDHGDEVAFRNLKFLSLATK